MTAHFSHTFLLGALVALVVALAGSACTEVTEKPEDCISGEYYENESLLCRTCPALEFDACPSTCGFVLGTDSDGCTTAECSCDACEEDHFFDRDAFECVACPEAVTPTCAEGVSAVSAVDDRGCTLEVCAPAGQVPCDGGPVYLDPTGTVNSGACPDNHYVPPMSTQCTLCEEGVEDEACGAAE